MKKLILLLIMLTFAWTVEVEAQTPTPSVDGYFNPLGQYEDNGFAPDGWSSYSGVLGYYERPDGTIEVFTNFDTLAGQFIDHAFVIDGENWYPSSAREGTYGIIEDVFEPGDWFSYGLGGVWSSQGNVIPLEWQPYGTHISLSYIDTARNQVVLVQEISDDPENAWDEPGNNIILWDGTNFEIIGSGMNSVTALIPLSLENAVLVVSRSSENPCFFKIDLEDQMLIPLSDIEDIGDPDGANSWNSGVTFLGRPTITGHFLGHGEAVTSLTETGWEETVVELSTSGMMYLDETGNKLFYCSTENNTNNEGETPQYMSGIAYTEDLVNFTPLYDKRLAKCTDGYHAIPLFSKGVMWVIAKRRLSAHLGNEDDANLRCDVFVLKDTYTPYTTEVNDPIERTIVIYPNPATEEFIYGFPLSANLFALDGRIVKTINENETSVDVRDVPSGIYILTLSDGSNSRIVITH